MKASKSCRTLAAAIAAVMVMAVGAVAQTWDWGDTPGQSVAMLSGGTLTVGGTGDMAPFDGDPPWQDYKNSITNVIINSGVTSIFYGAFDACSSLTTVTIPNTVTWIASSFYNCVSLTSITIPNSVTKFEGGSWFGNCTSLESATIGNGVTSLTNSMFSNCTNLKTVVIGSGVDTITNSAFYGCTSLTSLTIPGNVTSISNGAFGGCTGLESLTIVGNGATYIENGAFNGCTNLTSLTLGSGVVAVTNGAFYDCASLTSVAIGSGLTNLQSGPFHSCTNLTNINVDAGNTAYSSVDGVVFNKDKTALVIYPSGKQGAYSVPNTVTDIGSAFARCIGLTSVTIPNSVTEIGWSAFSYCTNLKSVTIPKSVTEIKGDAFTNCVSLKSVTIPNGVIEIGGSAFRSCSSLTSVTIPNSVTKIGGSAFESCVSLTSVVIPNGVTEIGSSTFYGCAGLKSVTIPSSVDTIGQNAFAGCTGLTSVISLSETPPYLKSYEFNTMDFCLYVPSVAFIDYLYAGWGLGESGMWESACLRDTAALRDSTIFARWDCGKVAGTVTATLKVDSTFTVSGAGDMEDYGPSNNKNPPWLPSHYNAVSDIVIENGVTSIGDRALQGFENMTSLTISNSVTSIGERAFFWSPSLKSLTIPNSVTSIGELAFWACTSLTSVTIPNSVVSIGVEAFSGTNLKSVTIPQSVTFIGEWAFYCENLKTVVSLAEVPVAFVDNDKMIFGNENVNSDFMILYVPKSAIAAYSSANVWKKFGSIKAIDELDCGAVPGTVTAKLGEDGTLTISGAGAMKDYGADPSDAPWYGLSNSIKSIVIGDGVTSVGRSAFSGGRTTPDGYWVPDGYPSLTSVTISNDVWTIKSDAFASCVNLTSLTIGSGVAYIESGAFSGCTSLTTVRVLRESPPDVSAVTFDSVPLGSVSLYVPQSAIEAYLTEDGGVWAGFGYINPSAVTFDSQGGTAVASRKVSYGGKLTAPAAPVRAGYNFGGWYKESACTTPWNFASDVVNSDVTLYAKWAQTVSVLTSDRVVPQTKPKEEATVIAPIAVLTGEFTAGPNPVLKQSGIVNFYRQGKRVSNSELRIYDATGNVINKVKISDKALNTQARRQVGSWNLKDKSGRTVSEGTYLVKGVIKTLDGKSEKVSLIIGVR